MTYTTQKQLAVYLGVSQPRAAAILAHRGLALPLDAGAAAELLHDLTIARETNNAADGVMPPAPIAAQIRAARRKLVAAQLGLLRTQNAIGEGRYVKTDPLVRDVSAALVRLRDSVLRIAWRVTHDHRDRMLVGVLVRQEIENLKRSFTDEVENIPARHTAETTPIDVAECQAYLRDHGARGRRSRASDRRPRAEIQTGGRASAEGSGA